MMLDRKINSKIDLSVSLYFKIALVSLEIQFWDSEREILREFVIIEVTENLNFVMQYV